MSNYEGLESQEKCVSDAYYLVYDSAFNYGSRSSKVCEDFLLAWSDSKAWGGWDPHRIVHLDKDYGRAVLILMTSIHRAGWFPPTEEMLRLAAKKDRLPIDRPLTQS